MLIGPVGIGIVILFVVVIYNTLVSRVNGTQNALRGIDVLLTKRAELIPNLVAVVQKYASHEKETLAEVTKMRSTPRASEPSVRALSEQDAAVTGAIGKLMMVAESYPDLKANENFIHLQSTLHEVESQLSAARRAFNAAATDQNNSVMQFPSNILAGMFGFKQSALYEAQESHRQNVDVKKLFSA